ncbi:MAG TPA: alpha/beta hydrolase-fold protein [Gaiellaceae bacterium]|nr:alpha/beta hydrolase-fold protein [Gaiellaceae bacterium]
MSELPYVRHPGELPVRYAYGPDSFVQPGVPRGRLDELQVAGRGCRVYVPAQYDGSEPASLLVFQDGWLNADPEGTVRAPVVCDNLIARGELPVTIGVFVDPGEGTRNDEYDAFDDVYASLLLEEILPRVQERWAIADDPERWAIAGGSSGGSCAFTVAWQRPDRFRRVLAFLASFAQIRGGNSYPELIRETPAKPLRVFLQAATRDIGFDRPELNWLSANLQVAAALAERGYDLRLVLGDGGHDPNHAGAILPDALRWLWR